MSITKETHVHINEIIKSLNKLSNNYHSETVFRDWCECFALTISNSSTLVHGDLWHKREDQYLNVIRRYKKEDIDLFCNMNAELILAFEYETFKDHLGKIYMEIFGGEKHLGQEFTPIDVCDVCSDVILGKPEEESKELIDDCCGGGAMLISACGNYYRHGVNYQKYLNIIAGDIDSLCVYMTYIQLSLIGAKAKVFKRDALTREIYACFETPMSKIGF